VSIRIRALHPVLAGEVEGIDLRAPLTPAEVTAIEAGMDRHAVLVFPGQDLSDEQQLAFSRNFGELERPGAASNITRPEDRRLGPCMADISNLDRHQQILRRDDRQRMFNLGNRLWHSDSSFKATPAKYSLLYCLSVASKGGNTEFADMRAAYDALDDERKALIEDLVCEHSQMFSRAQLGFTEFTEEERERFKPVLQVLVRAHPSTGRKSLYLSSHAGSILGWPVPEARFLLRDLVEHATQRKFVYSHKWRVGDLVIWDNRRTMHRVRPYPAEEARDMRRTTLKGEGPTVRQQAA